MSAMSPQAARMRTSPEVGDVPIATLNYCANFFSKPSVPITYDNNANASFKL